MDHSTERSCAIVCGTSIASIERSLISNDLCRCSTSASLACCTSSCERRRERSIGLADAEHFPVGEALRTDRGPHAIIPPDCRTSVHQALGGCIESAHVRACVGCAAVADPHLGRITSVLQCADQLPPRKRKSKHRQAAQAAVQAHICSRPGRQRLAGSRRIRGAAVDVPRPADVAAKGRSSCDTSYTGQARTASAQNAPCCASRQGTTSHAWVLACLSFSRLGSSSRTLCSMVSRATVSSSACVASMP